MKYNEIVDYIDNIPKFKKKPGLEKAYELLKRLNFNEEKFKVIHIAGTNGKGSVCAYMNSVLLELGYSVGMFTSPHLIKVNERIKINGEDISDNLLSEAFVTVKKINEEMILDGFDGINYFDFFFGMSIYCFMKSEVEYIILETGIGGIYDSTNTIKNPAICIITSISFDHTEVLGSTITEIAGSKAGIIKDNSPLIFSGLNKDAANVFIETAVSHKNVKYFFTTNKTVQNISVKDNEISYIIDDFGFNRLRIVLNTSAVYQADNSALVLGAVKLLSETSDFKYDLDRVLYALKNTVWQGRMECIAPNIYIDGAHNEDGINRFIESMQKLKKGRKIHLLFSAVKEKDIDKMIEKICNSGVFNSYVVTAVNGIRAVSEDNLFNKFLKYTDKVIAVSNIKEAFFTLKKNMKDDDIAACAGSLYLIGEIKKIV